MIHVDQTLFGNKNGNCFPACVATITGIALEEIPNFCVTHDDATWYRAFALWLRPRGYTPVSFVFESNKAMRNHLDWADDIAPSMPWIGCGETDRGKHAVVYVGSRMVHDPNPNHGRKGLIGLEDATILVKLG